MSSGPFRHVVACVDDSPATEAVVRLAVQLAGVREVFGPGTPTTAIVDYVRGLPVEPA